MGPRLLSRTAAAASRKTGARTTRATAETTISKRRLTIPGNPPYRHEDFGRVETHLVAEGPGPVRQGLEEARVGVVAQLALVARHGLQLRGQRGGDVHPRVRGERPGEGPLGAAGGVEGVDGVEVRLRRPGRDQDGL